MMKVRLKGKLFVLVALTVLLVTMITTAVLIANESFSRLNRFSFSLSRALENVNHTLAEMEYNAVQDSRYVAEQRLFLSTLYFMNSYHDLFKGMSTDSLEHEKFNALIEDMLGRTKLDMISVYDSSGLKLTTVKRRTIIDKKLTMDPCVIYNPSSDADIFFFEVNAYGHLQVVFSAPVFYEKNGTREKIGYLHTVKVLSGEFKDQIRRHDSAEFETAYLKADEAAAYLKDIWNMKSAKPLVFPFVEVKKGNLAFAEDSACVVSRWDIDKGASIYFRLRLPGYNFPYSFLNLTALFIIVFALMMLILIPYWWVFMRKTLINPINTLMGIADRVKAGNYSETGRQIMSGDEFQLLEKSFIDMMSAIKERENQLDDMNRELILRVDEESARRIKNEQLLLEQKKFADMGQMINAIAHQWRQPLNNLSLVLQAICDEAEEDTPDHDMITKDREVAMQLIEHMSATIDDFRSFFSTSKEIVAFDSVSAVHEVISLIRPQMLNHGIEISVRCRCFGSEVDCVADGHEPNCAKNYNIIKGIPGEFKQVILNFMQNSRDAITENCLAENRECKGRIEISLDCGEEDVSIRVKDNGCGIPEDIISKVFDPYFTTKEEGKGTGIGLYMSKVLITESMNGDVRVYNSETGAVFEVVLPRNVSGDGGAK